MIRSLRKVLKPASYITEIQDPDEIKTSYKYWRIRIFYSLFLGYTFFYFTRKNYALIMLYLSQELGFTFSELGIIGSVFYICYGISKFLSGVLCDRSNPRFFMAIGLILTGILNVLFAMSSSILTFSIVWGLNGVFQAWGWPACCKQLNYWFAKQERGLWYGICSTSHNVGGAIIPLISVYCAIHFGWRYALYVPALMSIGMGLFLINRLRDVPQSMGLPPIERHKPTPGQKITDCENENGSSLQPNILSAKEIMFKQVLCNKYVWIFSISYFFVYVVRTAINDWTIPYLVQEKLFGDMLAGWGVTLFEAGGVVGMIAAGWGSDYFCKGNRVPAMVVCAIGLIFAVLALWCTPANHPALDLTYLTLIGLFVYGPQMIVGLAAAEFVDKRAASASNGFSGTLGYFGAASAGYPLGVIIDVWGWDGFFMALMV
ncbi:MAG TPA: MFS transporter, partial [Gammaproteobacteria bacterium]|nr:MFS transporter [Gammaproteobacteria bacterium]